MIRLPQNRRWKSDYSSDVFGSFIAGQNLDFDQEGYLQLAQKPVAVFTETDDADFGIVYSIQPFDLSSTADADGYVICTDDRAFNMLLGEGVSITQIGDSAAFANTFPDALVFNAKVYLSRATTVDTWDGSNWTSDAISSLTTGVPHPLCLFENRLELAIGNGNTVKTYNTSNVLQNTCTLPTEYQVTTIRWVDNELFIGTRHVHGGEAKVFRWNGTGSAWQAGYGVRAARVYSLCTYQAGFVAIVSSGQILRWTGGGLSPLKDALGVEANFPVWYSSQLWQDEDSTTNKFGRVFDRGSVADGDLIYINVNSTIASSEGNTLLPNFPSGIWVFDPKVGLYHKALPSGDEIQTVGVSSVASSTLTLASSTQVQTGEPVLVAAVGSLTGITANLTYYAIVESATTIKLALTQADAYAGTYITLGGTAGVASLQLPSNNQIGSSTVSHAGAITLVSPTDVPNTFYNSNILWGVRTYQADNTTAVLDSLNTLSKAFNAGYFITPKIYSSNVKDAWQALYTKLKNLNFDTDSIVIKYRTRERFGLPALPSVGTYGTTTTIGGAIAYYDQVQVGDEVVITKGIGAGRSAHVVAKTGSELELDETIPYASTTDPIEFYVTDFKRLNQPITNQTDTVIDGFSKQIIDDASGWIQFKLELRGARVAVEELSLPAKGIEPVV